MSYMTGQGHAGGHWGPWGDSDFYCISKDGPLWMLGMIIRVHGAGDLPGASETCFPCSVCSSLSFCECSEDCSSTL